MSDSSHMNVLLARVGSPVRAITGTQAAPAFFELFTCILDRLDVIEARLNVRAPDVHPQQK